MSAKHDALNVLWPWRVLTKLYSMHIS